MSGPTKEELRRELQAMRKLVGEHRAATEKMNRLLSEEREKARLADASAKKWRDSWQKAYDVLRGQVGTAFNGGLVELASELARQNESAAEMLDERDARIRKMRYGMDMRAGELMEAKAQRDAAYRRIGELVCAGKVVL